MTKYAVGGSIVLAGLGIAVSLVSGSVAGMDVLPALGRLLLFSALVGFVALGLLAITTGVWFGGVTLGPTSLDGRWPWTAERTAVALVLSGFVVATAIASEGLVQYFKFFFADGVQSSRTLGQVATAAMVVGASVLTMVLVVPSETNRE